MSDINAQNSTSIPFFACYLEEAFAGELTEAEMAAIRGGQGMVVTLAYPSDPPENSGTDTTSPTMDVDYKEFSKFPSMPKFPEFPSISDYYKGK